MAERSKYQTPELSKDEWETALYPFDTDNNGFISYNAFCQVCEKKNIDGATRDEYWSLCGGDLNDESKLSIAHMLQKLPSVQFYCNHDCLYMYIIKIACFY